MGNALRQGVRQKMRASPGCFGIAVKDCIQRWRMSVQCSLSKLGLLLNQSKPIHELGYGIRFSGAMSDRCLRRHGVGNLDALKPTKPEGAHKAFKAYEPGYLHMDVKRLPQMADVELELELTRFDGHLIVKSRRSSDESQPQSQAAISTAVTPANGRTGCRWQKAQRACQRVWLS